MIALLREAIASRLDARTFADLLADEERQRSSLLAPFDADDDA